jgi:plasmid stabilization system protein ParE
MRYFLTQRSIDSLRDIRVYSIVKFGKPTTRRYFEDLTKGFAYLASTDVSAATRKDIVGDHCLQVYPIREHYAVYVTTSLGVIILDVVLQSRDVPNFLNKNIALLRAELKGLEKSLLKRKPSGVRKKP